MSEYKGLSDIAKEFGLKEEWKCWEDGKWFNEHQAFLEICKRIEKMEEQ